MKIVVTEPYRMADEVKASLAELGPIAFGPFTEEGLARELSDCEALMVRLGRRIDEKVLTLAPALRFVVTATTGLDHVDLAATRARGVRVISLRDCPQAIQDVSATAEHAWGLLLALMRGIPAAATHVAGGGWDRNLFFGTQLKGKRLGIVGYGRIGAMVGRYGAAFGMEVVAYDKDPAKIAAPATPASLPELIRTSDVISIHATASPGNRHLIDDRLVAQMKPGAVLINTARGSLLDEAAVAAAIVSGRLAGAAIDVLDGEENGATAGSPLLSCARAGHNVLITPHIGGATLESIAQAEGAVVEVLAVAATETAPR